VTHCRLQGSANTCRAPFMSCCALKGGGVMDMFADGHNMLRALTCGHDVNKNNQVQARCS
jgi:hypothetical protein